MRFGASNPVVNKIQSASFQGGDIMKLENGQSKLGLPPLNLEQQEALQKVSNELKGG